MATTDITGLVRSTDPGTSRDAAKSVDRRRGQRIVLAAFDQARRMFMRSTLTDEELDSYIEGMLGYRLPESSARKRRHDLMKRGLVEAAGERRNTRGRRMRTYSLTAQGILTAAHTSISDMLAHVDEEPLEEEWDDEDEEEETL